MTNKKLVAILKGIDSTIKTVYMWGTFGMPVTTALISQKAAQYPAYYPSSTQAALKALVGKNYFAFDCVGLIKGSLWGWSGDASKTNGGAVYTSNGVPDINANTMILNCKDLSTDFSKIEVGEAVWLTGHIGIYIGDGKVIEATPSWSNGVQTTACKNIGTISGLNARAWTKHGKLPYITYEAATTDNTGSGGDNTTSATDVCTGSNVRFAGGLVYSSSTAKTANGKGQASDCLVTGVSSGAAHPYHLVSQDGKGVFGWVDAEKVKAPGQEITPGAMVKITGDKYATGQAIPGWVKDTPHMLSKIEGTVGLVGSPTGINSRVFMTDLVLA